MVETDPLTRLVLANQLENAIDNVDLYYKEGTAPADIEKLVEYARTTGAPVPVIPTDGRRESVIKTLCRYWTVRETLGLQVALVGGIEDRFEEGS